MGIVNFSENIVLVVLPFEEPQISDELKNTNEIISNQDGYDVVIDFSRVEMITSSSISNLIILRRFLDEHGRKLTLCNVALVTKCIFRVAGLNEFFDFADDRFTILEPVGHMSQ